MKFIGNLNWQVKSDSSGWLHADCLCFMELNCVSLVSQDQESKRVRSPASGTYFISLFLHLPNILLAPDGVEHTLLLSYQRFFVQFPRSIPKSILRSVIFPPVSFQRRFSTNLFFIKLRFSSPPLFSVTFSLIIYHEWQVFLTLNQLQLFHLVCRRFNRFTFCQSHEPVNFELKESLPLVFWACCESALKLTNICTRVQSGAMVVRWAKWWSPTSERTSLIEPSTKHVPQVLDVPVIVHLYCQNEYHVNPMCCRPFIEKF